MKLRKVSYVAHRWLGLVVSVQLLAWSVGGLLFSVLDIEAVRGERGASEHAAPLLVIPDGFAPLARVATTAAAFSGVGSLALRDDGLGLRWIAFDAHGDPVMTIDPVSGEAMPPVTAEQAKAIAVRDRREPLRAVSTELIAADPPLEYRGKPLPAHRVALEGSERIHIYVHGVTGEITARRNAMWRVFDFFWMLHIMDYRGRENFNHWLLTSASVLAVVTAGSGLALWGWRVVGRTVKRPPIPTH